MDRYDAHAIESKWQAVWDEEKTWEVPNPGEPGFDDSMPKSYVLEMLPYPSGEPHMGHLKCYSIGDALAHFRRRNGMRVIHPMGYDAFGLPAENHAIKTGEHPRDSTAASIESFRRQFRSWGVSIDWSRELGTHEPSYYRWTQWIFLKLFEHGLAYRTEAPVQWCPNDATVLANEQVVDGRCERCGAEVVSRKLEQWFFKITDYADRLLADFELLESWPEHVITMQRNWIGRSEGAEVVFRCEELELDFPVFTTRPDTLFGATFFVLAPEHPALDQLVAGTPAQADGSAPTSTRRCAPRRRSAATRSAQDRRRAQPHRDQPRQRRADPDLRRRLRADGVRHRRDHGRPGHDARDYEFAQGLRPADPPRHRGHRPRASPRGDDEGLPYPGDGPMVNSGRFDGMPNREAFEQIVDWLESEGRGERAVNYRLRDWLVSRQRYWGAPIPIVYCEKCGTVPVPEDQLPVVLPEIEDYAPKGKSPLAAAEDWVARRLPELRRPGAPRDRHDGHLRRLLLVLPALPRPAQRRRRPSTAPPPTTGCPSTSTSAASSTRSST